MIPSRRGPSLTHATKQAQRREPERSAAAEIVPVFAVEGGGVATGLLSGAVALGATRAAAALAVPPHGLSVAGEAEAMAEESAAEHYDTSYPGGLR